MSRRTHVSLVADCFLYHCLIFMLITIICFHKFSFSFSFSSSFKPLRVLPESLKAFRVNP